MPLRQRDNKVASFMKISALLFALFAFLPIARADLTIVQVIETSAGKHAITLKIKGQRARIYVNPKSSMIVDAKTGEVDTLIPEQKAVLRLPAQKARNFATEARMLLKDTDTSLEIATPKPTGRKEKINGYETEEYVAETPKYRASYWVAKNYPDYQPILRQLKLLQNKVFVSVRKPLPEYYDFPGLPIRTKIKMQGQEETTTTITSVSQAPIPESEFTVPADYAEIKLPDFDLNATPPPSQSVAPTDHPHSQ
jgi:Domain of unknown function (DUF4412)